jgi:hypothetical protein
MFWYVGTKKNLATLSSEADKKVDNVAYRFFMLCFSVLLKILKGNKQKEKLSVGLQMKAIKSCMHECSSV